jgi:hypothetical protein
MGSGVTSTVSVGPYSPIFHYNKRTKRMSAMKESITPEMYEMEKQYKDLVDTLLKSGTIVSTPASATSWTTTTLGTVSPPKGKTLTAKTRMNKATLANLGPTYAFAKVKKKLVTDLLGQLMKENVVKVTSDVNEKTGAVTFTATVVANETA